MAVVTLEIVSPSSKSDGVFPMLLGVGCSLVGAGSSAIDIKREGGIGNGKICAPITLPVLNPSSLLHGHFCELGGIWWEKGRELESTSIHMPTNSA